MMLYPFVTLSEIDASLQKLSLGNLKCDNADDDDTRDNESDGVKSLCVDHASQATQKVSECDHEVPQFNAVAL